MFYKLCAFISFVSVWISMVNSLYFTMEDIEVTIPGDKRRFPPRERPIMTMHALQDSGLSSTINYTVSSSVFLDIESTSGKLTFSEAFYEKQDGDVLRQVVTVAASDRAGRAETTVRVTLDVAEWFDCDLLTKELCYWKSATYQVYENRPGVQIGSMSSPFLAEMCHTHRVKYTLLNGSNHIAIDNSATDPVQWRLRTLKPFERDIMRSVHTPKTTPFGVGARVYFGVRCTVAAPGGTERDMEETLYINVLDENDNAPVPQHEDTIIDVFVKDDTALKIKLKELNRNLMFIDRDSMKVNNYTIKLLGDDLKLFKVNYSIFEDDREGEPQTAIHCRIFASKNIQLPDPTYSIVLQINDTALLPEFGDGTANVTIVFHTNASSFRPKTPPAPANMKQNLLYPHEVTIFRYAAPFARVTQPKTQGNHHTNARKFLLKYDSSSGNKANGAFNVTVKGGIVYVQNIDALHRTSSPVTLEVQWEDVSKNIISDVFHVVLTQESGSSTCKNMYSSHIEWKHCADSKSHKSCTETCGLATGGNSSTTNYKTGGYTKCMWRGDKKPGPNLTKLYSTCTPDIDTCPDGRCDPLEELHFLICPQDCAEEVNWLATRNKETGLGISSASGICSCGTHGKCTCDFPLQGSKKKTSTTAVTETIPTTTSIDIKVLESNASAHIAIKKFMQTIPCGRKCLIGIAGSFFFLLGAISAVVAYWRASNNGKANRRERKYVESVNSLSGVQSDYVDRTIHSTDTLTLNFDMNTSLLQSTAPKIMPVDPKWEFPREKLHIEQTLGEGEFGRVLRAKALEISGMPGYTTVAVKTLKEDAREAELADLMSEYQLLKEVSHPNVIRLLGASTLPGGPVYLIIEFAELGSLRNYLRRSRHLESEGQTPCSGALLGAPENEPLERLTCVVKPKDILSFAWQISKGMAYLSDMKLVHRDLAARNVLLAMGMVCKISDFGLTRDVYEDDTYLKRTKGRVKWMAPESLADHIYNSKSDVWSFGIILWELVTLGASPYPGIAVQNLFHLLRSGYRMERPDNCSPALYKVMRSCWIEEPGERPSFRNLTVKLETMMTDGVEYLDLNPRVVHNRTYFATVPDALTTPDENDDDNLNIDRTSGDLNLSDIEKITKCADADKLQLLWKRPESPKPVNTRSYENDESAQELHHYESPIKVKRVEEPIPNENVQSYIDMAGKLDDSETLLNSNEERFENVSHVTSL